MWNTNARNCQDAQVVLQVLLTHVPPEELLQYQGARNHLEGLIPYTGQLRAGVCRRSTNCNSSNVKHIVKFSDFPPHRETHAEDWPTAAGLHVLELHVAQDESGRSTIQVGNGAAGKTANRLILVCFSFFEVFLQESTYSLC